jgi:hypothetical protein
MTITSASKVQFVVYPNPSSVISTLSASPLVYYQIGFTAKPSIILSYPNTADYIWA